MSNDQNRIAIFKNDKKEAGSKQPDYRLVGDFEGQRIKGGIWLDKSKAGQTYMSGKLERDEGQPQRDTPAQTADDSDFPF
jgi:uncharacterized protein (DUF736 family)